MLSFRITLLGRVGYLVLAIFGASGAFVFGGLGLDQRASMPLAGLVCMALIAVMFAFIFLYSLREVLRTTPRLELSEEGFVYRGFAGRLSSSWSNVRAHHLWHGGALLTSLQLNLKDRRTLPGFYTPLDVSGLSASPDTINALFSRLWIASGSYESPTSNVAPEGKLGARVVGALLHVAALAVAVWALFIGVDAIASSELCLHTGKGQIDCYRGREAQTQGAAITAVGVLIGAVGWPRSPLPERPALVLGLALFLIAGIYVGTALFA
jgi:hypothetical protein